MVATRYHAYKQLYNKTYTLARIYQSSTDPVYRDRIRRVCSNGTYLNYYGISIYGYLYQLVAVLNGSFLNTPGTFEGAIEDTNNIGHTNLPFFGSKWGYNEFLKLKSLFTMLGYQYNGPIYPNPPPYD